MKDDLDRFSKRVMKFYSFVNDWYEDIPGEIENANMIVLSELKGSDGNLDRVEVYNSQTESVMKLYKEDIEREED